MGRIGKAIARRCHCGFGMEVVFHNRSAVADPGVPARQVTLAEAMARGFRGGGGAGRGGDASPDRRRRLRGDEAHRHLREHLARRCGGRGGADRRPCRQGRIAGAGLDVYEFEPKVPAALIAMENVTLLPHLGTAALEVREAMGMLAVENLVAVLEGRAPPNPV